MWLKFYWGQNEEWGPGGSISDAPRNCSEKTRGEPAGLQPMELPRIGHDWATSTHTLRLWRCKSLGSLKSSCDRHLAIPACVLLFSTPNPLRAHSRAWESLQGLRAWQLAACLSPSFVSILSSLRAGCSGLMAAASFVYWFGNNIFSLTPWTSEESFSHCLGPMEKVSYFHKHKRDPCPLAALQPRYHLGWFLRFQRNKTGDSCREAEKTTVVWAGATLCCLHPNSSGALGMNEIVAMFSEVSLPRQ